MVRKLLVGLVVVGVALVALPPLWFTAFPGDPPPELPAPGRSLALASGVRINALEQGRGPAVLLVHGLPGTAYEWRELSRELAERGRRVIAIDRSGYGHSDANPEGDYSVQRNAADVIELMEAMELRDVTLVGWSYGGGTAQLVAARRPESLARVVLIGTGGPDGPDARPPEANAVMRLFYSDAAMRWRSAVPPVSTGLIRVLSDVAYSGEPMPEWWVPGVVANFQRWETLLTYRGEMFGIDADQGFDYADIAVPTLLLHGDDDRLATVEIARYLVTVIPGARLIETPGGSHMLPVTHAAEVADRIVAFAP